MQKVLFITNIEHFKISSHLGRGEQVGDKFFITNDRSFIDKLLTSNFHEVAGTLEAHYLKTAHAVAYDIKQSDLLPDDNAAESFLIELLAQVKLFMNMLWLVKDNSANVDLGYLERPYKSSKSSISRNSFAPYYSTASGETRITEFSRNELRKARELFTKLDYKISFHTQVASEDRFGRFERSFYFLQAARSSSDLGVKIANYCTCLESLFSSDSKELSHKLSERVACFLETDLTERIKIFKLIKKAYNIRSKVIHGAKGSSKLSHDIDEAAVSCDQILRRVLLTMLEEPSLKERFIYKKEADDEDYFVSLVLSPCNYKRNADK